MALRDDEMNQPIIRPDPFEHEWSEGDQSGYVGPGGEMLDRFGRPLNAAAGTPAGPGFTQATSFKSGSPSGGMSGGAGIAAALANALRPSPSLSGPTTTEPGRMPFSGGTGFDASEPLINRSRGGVSPALGSVLRGGQGNDQTPLTQALMAQLLQRRGTPPRIV